MFPSIEAGGQRLGKLMAEPSKPALVKNPSITGSSRKSGRRVAFEEPTNDHSHTSVFDDIGGNSSSFEHIDKGRRHPHCFACCAWACLGVFVVVIILLFIGISYLAFLKGGMPKVNVRALSVNKLQVDDRSQKMDATIGLGLRFSNKNEQMKLLYGPLFVDVSSEDVALGEARIRGFSQMPQNDTDLNMNMTMNHANVDKYAADELKADIKAYEMVFDVYVSGKIGIQVGSLHMINVPFLSTCHQIKKLDVDFGRRPECEVKMFAYR